MPIDSIAALIDALRQGRLLPAAQLDVLTRTQTRFSEPRSLAKDLLQRGWLTAYQINQLFQGQGAGLLLGQYLLLERLGAGGMGQVFKARHQRLERIVALKVIRPERLSSPDAVQRFQREARAAARLHHPNIVTVFDADEVNGTHFIAMEYVEGIDLAKLVKQQGPLPVGAACDYVRQAALGLQHAHEQRLVHRDIKPHNLLLTQKGGAVKVLDMGLARLHNPMEEEDGGTEALTREGTVMGTPDYIAPEQAVSSHTVDIRADLYSLGGTLYFLLSGKPPFPGGSLAEKLLKHQNQEPRPVEQLRPDVPPGVAAVVRKLLAKRPEQRYQTPAELATVLAPFCPAGSITATHTPVALPVKASDPESATTTAALAAPLAKLVPDSTIAAPQAMPVAVAAGKERTAVLTPTLWLDRLWQHWRRCAAIAGGVLLVVLLFILVSGPRKAKGTRDGEDGDDASGRWPAENWDRADFSAVKAFDWPPEGLETILGNQRGRHWGPVRSVALSPDGKWAASAGDDGLICLWDAEPTPERALQERALFVGHTGAVLALAFSPDSRRLLSGGADKTVRLWDIKERKQVWKAQRHTDPVACVAFSDDGRRALSGAGGELDHSIRLWEVESGQEVKALEGHSHGVTTVAFAPDGRVLSGGKDEFARVWDAGSGNEVSRLKVEGSGGIMAFSPDGRRIVAHAPDHGGMLLDAATGKIVYGGYSPHPSATAFSRDGRQVILGCNEGAVGVHDTEAGTLLRRLEGHTTAVSCLASSPDGRRVLSGSLDHTVRLWDIQAGKEVRPVKGHTLAVHRIAFSVDGRRALTGGAEGIPILWDLENRSLGREIHRLPNHRLAIGLLALSPDGRRALTGSFGSNGAARLWDVEKGEEVFRLEKPCLDTTFAEKPYVIVGTGFQRWRIVDMESKQETTLPPTGGALMSAAFFPVGNQVIASYAFNPASLVTWNLQAPLKLTESKVPGGPINTYAFSTDGSLVILGHRDGSVHMTEVNLAAPKPPVSLVGHTSTIGQVAFSPDDKTVAACAADGQVILWDAASHKQVRKWRLPGTVHGVAFTPDGRLALANANGTAYLLRLASADTGR